LDRPRRFSTGAAFSILDFGIENLDLENLLTADEEVGLGRRVRAGDLAARNELVQRNRSFAVQFAIEYRRRCRCWDDDLVQAALLGLIRGADAFDPDRYPGTKFLTIARYYVRMEILKYLYGRALIRIPHSARPTEIARHPLGERSQWEQFREWTELSVAKAARVASGHLERLNCPDHSQFLPDIEDSRAQAIEQLRLALETLPLWHADVLKRRFGLDGRCVQSVKTIAREARLSSTSVYKVQKLALRRLRKAMSPCLA
jgi:RNA polymerase sigma factor (sigma-70 family)